MAKKKITKIEETEKINDVSLHALNVVTEEEAVEAVEAAQEELTEAKEELKEAKEVLKKLTEDDIKEETVSKKIKVEIPQPIVLSEPEVIKEISAADTFKKAISKTPFTILQNGTLVCTYSPFLNIKIENKYFEINNKKYTYVGLEFKY